MKTEKKLKIKKEDKFRVYWDKKENDIMFYHPAGRNTGADGWYYHSYVFTSEFLEEMKRRGYDITTIKFEITPDINNERFENLKLKYYGK